jgi:LysM repeat protein
MVRIVAPLVFFAAATVLVIVIQRGLEQGEARSNDESAIATSRAETTAAEGTTGTAQIPKTYRVKAGDTLDSIASRFDTTVDDLLRLNPEIDPLALTPGQKVRVR